MTLKQLAREYRAKLRVAVHRARSAARALQGRPPLTEAGPIFVGRHAFAEPRTVEVDVTPAQREALFARVSETWTRLGETEPHWSVLTSDEFRQDRIGETSADFYASGGWTAWLMTAALARQGLSLSGLTTCLEFGCGVGRITLPLRDLFPQVIGVDISAAHLKVAQAEIDRRQVTGIDLKHVTGMADIAALPRFDALFTLIVLQHNPPPLIAEILDTLFGLLNPGGVCFFQVPVYCEGYGFEIETYLANPPKGMEMHVLPQSRVFSLMQAHGIAPLEVMEDTMTGHGSFQSLTFLGRKAPSTEPSARSHG